MDNEGKIQELIDRMARLESDSERNEIIIKNQEEEIKNLKSMVSELTKDRNDTNIAVSKILLMLEAQHKRCALNEAMVILQAKEMRV